MSVTLRKRKLKGGKYSLVLDIYHNRKRQYEWLDFKLNGDAGDKELLQMANSIRARRQLELQSDTYDMPSFKRKINFFEYAAEHTKQLAPNTLLTFKQMFTHLKWFAEGDQLTLNEINHQFCQKFATYLLSQVKANSAITYFSKFKAVLGHAVKEGILSKSPALGVR